MKGSHFGFLLDIRKNLPLGQVWVEPGFTPLVGEFHFTPMSQTAITPRKILCLRRNRSDMSHV
ncbi:hypothetical protein [Paenibacillus oceani]|uniref:Uncharacterized protein n=1 Tax=Paenibacillus oceani TaxID=2772510 RepID=A0A927CGW7_9BACL|nr:hypothetical protein [Paenibacillus oceani]MBD2866377.1 hypothetical protein [Paenibacillus oceani]